MLTGKENLFEIMQLFTVYICFDGLSIYNLHVVFTFYSSCDL